MISMGIDIGSSSVKISLLDCNTGREIVTAQYPEVEMPITALQPGWAEQSPDMWYDAFVKCTEKIRVSHQNELGHADLIGISYQMHGLVCIAKNGEVIRPAIIWCDSRAVDIGERAMQQIGQKVCLTHFLNSPGNFTASKLRWVKENEPNLYERIYKIMLPGDYLGFRLTGEINTTITGLSEGIIWDFTSQNIAKPILDYYEIDQDLIPEYGPSFRTHGQISKSQAKKLGLSPAAKIYYKAGDQPNNALSLNVLKSGEVAATAGTSGVVYAATDQNFVDVEQRVNAFAHVNYTRDHPMLGILLCINGVGIANSWIKNLTGQNSYPKMNNKAAKIAPGSAGVMVFPFGNGAERMLQNNDIGGHIQGLNFNIHGDAHLWRATQEGIAFAFAYGMKSFSDNGINLFCIKAGSANMFLSPIFTQVLADVSGVPIQLYNTDGSLGAARGAVIGAGLQSSEEVFAFLENIKEINPGKNQSVYLELLDKWNLALIKKSSK